MTRDVKKTIIYRIYGTCIAFFLSMLLTGNISFSIYFTSIEAVVKSLGYLVFEKLWKRFDNDDKKD